MLFIDGSKPFNLASRVGIVSNSATFDNLLERAEGVVEILLIVLGGKPFRPFPATRLRNPG
jgi:hypothetical protein